MKTICFLLFAFAVINGVAMDKLGLDGIWDFRFEKGLSLEEVKMPGFAADDRMTRMTVRESINHPCIIISGVLNEPHSGLPECRDLVNRLAEVVRSEDSGHLVTFACSHTTKDISHVKTFQAEYTKLMLEEMFKVQEISGIAIWQFTDSKTYTRTPG